MVEYSKVEEARAAYEAAIREFYEYSTPKEVMFFARKLCEGDWRTRVPCDEIVTHLQSGPMLHVGLGEYAMETHYVPHWAIYITVARTMIAAAEEWDGGRV